MFKKNQNKNVFSHIWQLCKKYKGRVACYGRSYGKAYTGKGILEQL